MIRVTPSHGSLAGFVLFGLIALHSALGADASNATPAPVSPPAPASADPAPTGG